MSKANQLEVLGKDISVPGCTFTKTSLRLAVVDEEALLHAGAFLDQVEVSRAWWHGDFLLAYCEFRLAQESDSLRGEAKRDPKMRLRLYRRYTAERAEIAKVEVDTLHEWRNVCAFYEPLRRRSELSNKHHVEAMQAADGDSSVADDWLDQAVESKWTVPQLRAAIRRAKQGAVEPDEPMPQVTQQELFACARWARTVTKRVDDMPTHEARQLLTDLQPIVALAARIEARLAAAETKESITAAA